MRGRKPKLFLPYAVWPTKDRQLWEDAMAENDPFSDSAGARLAQGTKEKCLFGWRRFLGFLSLHEPAMLELEPKERITPERILRFVAHLGRTNRPQSVAIQLASTYNAARIMMPRHDWSWMKSVIARLHRVAPASARAKPSITSVQLLELGLQL